MQLLYIISSIFVLERSKASFTILKTDKKLSIADLFECFITLTKKSQSLKYSYIYFNKRKIVEVVNTSF